MVIGFFDPFPPVPALNGFYRYGYGAVFFAPGAAGSGHVDKRNCEQE